jgi:asparagine synthase (glutamine-hydrolysing)
VVHCRDALLRQPITAIRNLRAHRIQERWTRRALVAEAVRTDSYATWLAHAAERMHHRAPSPTHQILGWDTAPQMPHWATDEACEIAYTSLLRAARNAAPLSPRRGLHADLAVIQFGTRTARILHQQSEARGLPMQSPYFDDRVIEACLAVDPLERANPWDFKPLIKEAMRGLVEDSLLTRRTKGSGDSDKVDGLHRHRDDIAALWSSSQLADRGLVDTAHLHDKLYRPGRPAIGDSQLAELVQLDNTIACERWLTSHAQAPEKRTKVVDHAHR